jgi:acyl-CoA synthetase (AMP-forming)/AMP-acid ligase II
MDRLGVLLADWRGAVASPQEAGSVSGEQVAGMVGRWRAAPAWADERPYVATAFTGTGLNAAVALVALWSAGYAPAPLDTRLDAAGLAARLRLARPGRVLAEPRHAAAAAAAMRVAGLPEDALRVVAERPAAWGNGLGLGRRDAGGDDPGMVVFTSGTTGAPKGVLLSRTNLAAVAGAVAEAQGLGPDDRVLNALSLAHVNAPVVALLGTVASGGDVLLLRRFDPGELWRVAAEQRATWANLAPPLIATLLRYRAATGTHRPALRFVRSASAPLTPATARAFEEAFGVPVVESYGISEAASQVTINDVPPGERRPGWVGWPRGAELRVVDEDGADMPTGGVGEVLVRGPGVMLGYLDDPFATEAVLREGWLATGDLAELDATGALRLVGRRSEQINRGGEKIAPRAIEEALLGHAGIAEVAVAGVPDPVYGQEIHAYVVARPGAELTAREVRGFARSVLPLHMRPRGVTFVDELPRTANGKLLRRELAAAGAG